MSFKDTNTARAHLGNVVRFTPNTKGTGTRGLPTNIQLMSKDYTLGVAVNPDGQANRFPVGDFDSSDKGSQTRTPGRPMRANKHALAAVENPDAGAEKNGSRATRRVAKKSWE